MFWLWRTWGIFSRTFCRPWFSSWLSDDACRLKRQFRQLLQDTQLVGPGKSLSDVAIFFLGRECFTGLTEKEKQDIYDDHQAALRGAARRDFLELLLENAESLVQFENSQVTNNDIDAINSRLQSEPRQVTVWCVSNKCSTLSCSYFGMYQPILVTFSRNVTDTCICNVMQCKFKVNSSNFIVLQIKNVSSRTLYYVTPCWLKVICVCALQICAIFS